MNILNKRFNFLDVIWIQLITVAMVQGKWLLWIILTVVGAIAIGSINYYYDKRQKQKQEQAQDKKDREWQFAANNGSKVEAIKIHRQIYGSSLKEALEAVDAYLGNPPRP